MRYAKSVAISTNQLALRVILCPSGETSKQTSNQTSKQTTDRSDEHLCRARVELKQLTKPRAPLRVCERDG